ncbi:MAG: glycosyltransferase [Bacteroidales bacterium]|nr:glycosyltransferase [Bacteroidales bacterium]
MNNTVYAPVMVTTICRFEKFKRCIESLANCTDADKTEIFIGVDYPAAEEHWEGYRKICEYLPSIKGFKRINIFKRPENLGQSKNVKDLRNRIKENYDRYITTEDDNEFSPDFLQYMNQCLEKFKDDPKVFAICGYSYQEWENVGDYPYNAYPMEGFCAWGVGNWFAKTEKFTTFHSASEVIHNPKYVKQLFKKKMHITVHRMLFRYDKSGGDLRRRCYCALENKCSVFPAVSKVRNHGFDGEGANCAVINTYAKQRIDESPTFALDDFGIKQYPQIDKLHDIQYAGNLLFRMLVRIEYFQWRFTGKAFRDWKLIRALIELRVKYSLNK